MDCFVRNKSCFSIHEWHLCVCPLTLNEWIGGMEQKWTHTRTPFSLISSHRIASHCTASVPNSSQSKQTAMKFLPALAHYCLLCFALLFGGMGGDGSAAMDGWMDFVRVTVVAVCRKVFLTWCVVQQPNSCRMVWLDTPINQWSEPSIMC
jgi:hypothetical protein